MMFQDSISGDGDARRGDGTSRRMSGGQAGLKEPRRQTETEEYLVFVRRTLRALAARVGEADAEALREMVALRGLLETCITDAIAGLRNDGTAPASWGEIARALGVTRQAAQRRYGHLRGKRRPGGQPGGWR